MRNRSTQSKTNNNQSFFGNTTNCVPVLFVHSHILFRQKECAHRYFWLLESTNMGIHVFFLLSLCIKGNHSVTLPLSWLDTQQRKKRKDSLIKLVCHDWMPIGWWSRNCKQVWFTLKISYIYQRAGRWLYTWGHEKQPKGGLAVFDFADHAQWHRPGTWWFRECGW